MICISLGGTCAVAYFLRNLEKDTINYQNSPFDWCKLDIKKLNKVLNDDFAEFCTLKVKKFSMNHPYFGLSLENIESDQGSLILENNYGIQFAHQIIEKNMIPEFIVRLEERIKCFRQLFTNEQTKITFVRFESGKLNIEYLNDLKKLMNYLIKSCVVKFTLILIIHIDSKFDINEELLNSGVLVIHYYDKFDSDWRYPEVFDNLKIH